MFKFFFRKNNRFFASRSSSLTILIKFTFLYTSHFQLSENYENRYDN